MVGREGFEPSKAEPTDLQSVAFNHFAISPKEYVKTYCMKSRFFCKEQIIRLACHEPKFCITSNSE